MQNIIVENLTKCPKLPWMVDFHTTKDGDILNNQLTAAYASTYVEHLASLTHESKLSKFRLTQIACPIPPNPTEEFIESLLIGGMTMAVIQVFYTTPEECEETVLMLRSIVAEYGKKVGRYFPLAIALDITEPDVHIGTVKPPKKEIDLEKGSILKITSDPAFENKMTKNKLFAKPNIAKFASPGDTILFGNSQVRVSALEVAMDVVKCIVERAGKIISNLPVKLPTATLILSPKILDETRLELALKLRIDFILVGDSLVNKVKEILGKSTIIVITKIENCDNFDDIVQTVKYSDAIMIDPECMIEELHEQVFLTQKSLIGKCYQYDKPVFCSINYASVERNEMSTIYTTILDGVDGILIPPVDLDKVSLICRNAEVSLYQRQLFRELNIFHRPPIEPMVTIAIATVEASMKTSAAAIIVLTTSGRTAKILSRFRPRCPIIGVTRYPRIGRQLQLYRSVLPLVYTRPQLDDFQLDLDEKVQLGVTFGKLIGLIKMGDALVIVTGFKIDSGFTNCMKIVFASEYDTHLERCTGCLLGDGVF